MRLTALAALIAASCLTPKTLPASDVWTQFRGPDQGQTEATGLPLHWSETEHLKWKTELPGEGWSSPVVSGRQVWMSAATKEGHSLRALCCDLETGKLVMDVEVFSNEVVPPKHLRNSYASPTPTIDGDRIYVDFGEMGIACLSTKDGKKLWENRELVCDHQNGPGGSAVLHGDKLLIACDGMDVQYGAALDKRTGKLAWKVERSAAAKLQARPPDLRKAYGTPIVFNIEGRPTAVTAGAERLYGTDPDTGKELWFVDYPGFSNVATSVFDGKRIYASTGFPKAELWAIRASGMKGDLTATHVLWKQKTGAPDQSTPVVVGDRLYMVNSTGIASCVDTANGEVIWKERIGPDFAASPLHSEGRLYFWDTAGKCKVIAASDTFTILAENTLDAGFMASPAVVGKSLVVRTKKALYRIE